MARNRIYTRAAGRPLDELGADPAIEIPVLLAGSGITEPNLGRDTADE